MATSITWQNSKQWCRRKIRMKYPSLGQNRLRVAMADCCHVLHVYEIIQLRGPQGWQSGEPVQLMMARLQSGGGKMRRGVIILRIDTLRGSRRAGLESRNAPGNYGQECFLFEVLHLNSLLFFVRYQLVLLKWCIWFIKNATTLYSVFQI